MILGRNDGLNKHKKLSKKRCGSSRRIFPLTVLGSAMTKSIFPGCLYRAVALFTFSESPLAKASLLLADMFLQVDYPGQGLLEKNPLAFAQGIRVQVIIREPALADFFQIFTEGQQHQGFETGSIQH